MMRRISAWIMIVAMVITAMPIYASQQYEVEEETVSVGTADNTSACEESGNEDVSEALSDGAGLSNPRYDNNNMVTYEGYDSEGSWKEDLQEPAVTWDCVWFGSYIQDASYDKENYEWTVGTEKKPIKWRVLSVDGDDAFLLADKSLDFQPYNTEDKDVTWETCTLRSWLNTAEDGFYNTAFSESEKSAIVSTTIKNADIPQWDVTGGNDTTDNVFLLSRDDIINNAYGFNDNADASDPARWAKNTDYARARGAYTSDYDKYTGNGDWWLRSPGYLSGYAVNVVDYGHVERRGSFVYGVSHALRPALHISLSSSLWTPAGTVCSDGTVDESAPTGQGGDNPPKPDTSSSSTKSDTSSSAKDDSSSSVKSDATSSAKNDTSSSTKSESSSSSAEPKSSSSSSAADTSASANEIAALLQKKGNEGYAASTDTVAISTAGKVAEVTIPAEAKAATVTMIAGDKLGIKAEGATFTSNTAGVKVNKKGVVTIKKNFSGVATIDIEQNGVKKTLTINVYTPTLDKLDKQSYAVKNLNLTAVAKAGDEIRFAVKAPISAKFDTSSKKFKNKGVLTEPKATLEKTVVESNIEKGLWIVTGKVSKKGTVTLPFTAGKKTYKCKIKVKLS